MPRRTFFPRIATSLAVAALFSLALTPAGFAQGTQYQTAAVTSSPPGNPLVLQIQTPQNGFTVNGNLTVTGTAVDCNTGQAASRVAVYDGPNTVDAAYLADVSMDTTANLGNFCAGRSGSDKVGFTLIYDTHPLADGPHLLTFMSQYPSGGSQTVTFNLTSINGTMYAGSTCNIGNCNDPTFQGHYYGNYGGGDYYGNDATYQGHYYAASPDNSYNSNNYYNQGYAGAPYASPYGVNAVYGNGVVPLGPSVAGGLGTSGIACASYDAYGNCTQYQSTATTGVQCISVDAMGNCTAYQNTGATYGSGVNYGCPSYVSAQTCLNAQGGMYQGNGAYGAGSYVATCPGIPGSQCVYNSQGQYTRIN
jgi:hypothetical protein